MQMIHDAAKTALHSEMMKKLFEKEQTVHEIEFNAINGARNTAGDEARAERLSDACRAKADEDAEAVERAAFEARKAKQCA